MAITKRICALAALGTITISSAALAAPEPPITAEDAAAFMEAELGPTVTEAACHDFENADGWGRFLCFARVGDGTQLVKATMGAPDGVFYLGQPFVAVIESERPQLSPEASAVVGDISAPTVEDAVSAFAALALADLTFPACNQRSPQVFTCYAVLFNSTTMDNRLISGTVAFDVTATPPVAWNDVHTFLTDPNLPAPVPPAAVFTVDPVDPS